MSFATFDSHRAHDVGYLLRCWRELASRAGLRIRRIARAGDFDVTCLTSQNNAPSDSALLYTLEKAARHGPVKILYLETPANPTNSMIDLAMTRRVVDQWAVASGQPIEELAASNNATTTLSANPDGSFIASKSISLSTGSTPQWALERTLGDPKNRDVFTDRVNAVRFSPDGKLLATGTGDPSRSGDVAIFDVASGKAVQTWKERHDDAVLTLDFSPDGKLLASGAADTKSKLAAN